MTFKSNPPDKPQTPRKPNPYKYGPEIGAGSTHGESRKGVLDSGRHGLDTSNSPQRDDLDPKHPVTR